MSGNRTVSAGVEADWSREVTRTLIINGLKDWMTGNRTVSAGVEADWSREVTRALVIPDVNRCDSLIIIIIIKGIYIAQVRKGLTTKTKK